MTVTYAILPNVRHGCDLTRPGVRPPRLPACFTTSNDNDLATSCLARSCRNLRIASSRNSSVSSSRLYMSRWVIWLAQTRRVKKSARHPSLASTPTRAYAQQTHRIAALLHRPIASEFASLHRGHWASNLRASSSDHSTSLSVRPNYRPFGHAFDWLT